MEQASLYEIDTMPIQVVMGFLEEEFLQANRLSFRLL